MTSRTPTEADASLSLLRRLVDDAMDPGYQEATTRGGRQGADWRRSVAVGVVVGLTAALGTAAVLQARAGAPDEGVTRSELIDRVKDATGSVEASDIRVDELNGEIETLRQSALDGSDPDRALADEVTGLEAEVGVTAVAGPGVEVVMDDGPPAPAGAIGPDIARVLDADISLVVNGLFAAGADAVAVNGQRITALSPIRSAGEAILVGFRPLSPPYTVTAIGTDNLTNDFESGEARVQLEQLETAYGIDVEVVAGQELSVPGRGDLQLRYVTTGESS